MDSNRFADAFEDWKKVKKLLHKSRLLMRSKGIPEAYLRGMVRFLGSIEDVESSFPSCINKDKSLRNKKKHKTAFSKLKKLRKKQDYEFAAQVEKFSKTNPCATRKSTRP